MIDVAELVTWLRAELADDEAGVDNIHTWDCGSIEGGIEYGDVVLRRTASECDCGIPGRLRREVEAKRRRLARHTPTDDSDRLCTHCSDLDCWPIVNRVQWPCPDIRDDLAVYADRPGYRSEWAP